METRFESVMYGQCDARPMVTLAAKCVSIGYSTGLVSNSTRVMETGL